MKTLPDVFEHEIQDLYDAEVQLTKALPKLAKHAMNEKLTMAFEEHLEQTRGHVSRLKEIAETIGISPKGKPCKGMKGLVAEGAELLTKDASPAIDAALIGAAQRVEHYEMAAYGTAIAHAKLLEQEDLAEILTTTLDEEQEADKKLSELAETDINNQAMEIS
jgi:ferritin-like metal-binding protein YciE